MLAWGLLLGLFFSGVFIMAGNPVEPFDHAMWGGYALFFSSMCCIGMGRFINDTRFGNTLAVIAAITVAIVFALRGMGILPS